MCVFVVREEAVAQSFLHNQKTKIEQERIFDERVSEAESQREINKYCMVWYGMVCGKEKKRRKRAQREKKRQRSKISFYVNFRLKLEQKRHTTKKLRVGAGNV